ncbi:MAG: DUF5317 family protein [Parcubacteria group bacterium]|nr:DUF5317 family protein [Parcubacteria group bacterium]
MIDFWFVLILLSLIFTRFFSHRILKSKAGTNLEIYATFIGSILLLFYGAQLISENKVVILILIGVSLNLIVCVINKFRMPVRRPEEQGRLIGVIHKFVEPETRLLKLADIISIPFEFKAVNKILIVNLSIGDIFMIVGWVVFILVT